MEVKTLQDIFINILSSELNETELEGSVKDMLTFEVISDLYALSKRHDLAHIVSSSLYKASLLTDGELSSKFKQEEIMSLYRNEQMKCAYDKILNAFEEAKIEYVPLKGSVIRPYYPKESMRTSCDIDILIREEALDEAIKALTEKGFECGEKNYHDVVFFYPNNVHLELHFNIKENMDNIDALLKDVWLYIVPAQGGVFRRELSKKFFSFHMFAHMSYHFLRGGCGIRPLMDIWIMEHKMGITWRDSKDLLEKAGILKFALEMENLADICFSDKPKDDFSDTLLSYILKGGVYGTKENEIAVTKVRDKNTFVYVLKRLFLPYRIMIMRYPILKKLPVLLPFCWVIRLIDMLFGKKAGRTITELKKVNDVSGNEFDKVKNMRNRLGI